MYSLESVQGKENQVTHVADGKHFVLKIKRMQRTFLEIRLLFPSNLSQHSDNIVKLV